MDKPKPFVILGEASESDDDEKEILNVVPENKKLTAVVDNKGLIVAGEASESDSECEETFREAFFARSGATKKDVHDDVPDSPQYDTLLHKKLRESNLTLYNDVNSLARDNLVNAIQAINSTNQQLVASQINVQDAASSIRKAFVNMTKITDCLNTVLATPYIPEINIP